MSNKALAILRKNTKPKTKSEVQEYLVKRHGAVARENASADLTALDDRARLLVLASAKKSKTRAVR
ncbi:hypothetical protein [Pseudoduganella namucuonensis]|uniref:Uncharacterized protein n=1 Tax=Pseudoduganella namucuonensis TaxID=1035707 RepID=A0A1I7LPE5_9BURK|nr:hypothetical protein [Pseudoduganella namucuonensis]SFV11504.1 hypothetical protein SAMN05216552_103423 [Pseudoduganella namucuonensis]